MCVWVILICIVWMYMLRTLLRTHVTWSKEEKHKTLEPGMAVPISCMAIPNCICNNQKIWKAGMVMPYLCTIVPSVGQIQHYTFF